MPVYEHKSTLPTRRHLLRGIGAGAVAAGGAGLLGACSSREVQETAATASSGSGFTITDQRGKRISFDRPVERIVTAIIPSPSMLAAVDGTYSHIVGINESTLTANRQGIFGTVFPESKKTTTIAGADFVPNVESVMGLEPDVVLQWADMGDEIIKPLETAGLKVIGLTYGTQEMMETWVTFFGKLLGKEERSSRLLDWMHTEDAAIRKLVAPGLSSGRQKVLYLKAAADGFTTATGADYVTHWTELAGGRNVAEKVSADAPQVSTEQIIAWDPEVIFLSAFDEKAPSDLYGDRSLSSVSAVRDRRVYKVPLGGYRWDPPCCESPLMWRWAAQVLHPGIAARSGLREKIKETFDLLYGYEISTAQTDEVLRLDLNAKSANYAGFRA
ncbi:MULTISPECIES: ABC transporter substrate-binding protein [unclassified Streptomyces]|uniref:ABC transporter substrate-binding protein n=1 Tax=unclassified Streptomyces TaxID=2593676 RepID=UPI00093EE577|nr:ABC transporter substrate-binding protein [Streptomyces sp. CB02058]OKI88873.1 Fe3+-citrate ABC transporter substrate-binding protein [Streptomyces sp. CB02058]